MPGIFGGLLGSLSGLVVQYLVVAGGGGGQWTGSGGGAGGFIEETSPISLESYTVTVGAGGTGGVFNGVQSSNGGNSFFNSRTVVGGGAGVTHGGVNGIAGGSGSGSPIKTGGSAGVGGSPTTDQGFRGGNGYVEAGWNGISGGGGGAGGVGFDAGPGSGSFGQGGPGKSSSITGSSVLYAGGGAGGDVNAVFGALGGSGGGGRSNANAPGTAGLPNTGGGGGGGAYDGNYYSGGAGGSGVVILRYPSSYSIIFGGGLTASTSSLATDKVTTITSGTGNIAFTKGSTTFQSALNSSPHTGLIGQFFPGVNYTISTGDVGTLPLSNPTTYSSISYINQGDLYGFIAIGYFKPPTTGTYTFFTSSDDGSGVWVGSLASAASGRTAGNAVLNNNLDGGQGDTKRSGTISLTAGEWYAIRIVQEEGGGGDNLTFSWSGPGIAETTSLATHFKRPVNLEGSLINTFYQPT